MHIYPNYGNMAVSNFQDPNRLIFQENVNICIMICLTYYPTIRHYMNQGINHKPENNKVRALSLQHKNLNSTKPVYNTIVGIQNKICQCNNHLWSFFISYNLYSFGDPSLNRFCIENPYFCR